MSIYNLKVLRNEYCKYTNPNDWRPEIQNFMTETINTFEALEALCKANNTTKLKKWRRYSTAGQWTKRPLPEPDPNLIQYKTW